MGSSITNISAHPSRRVDVVVRPRVNSGDCREVEFDLTTAVQEAFDAAGISIPFPQRDVHVFAERAG